MNKLFFIMKPFCNKCYSLCCLMVSCWGIIQLPIIGLFLYLHSPAFIEAFEHALDLEPPFTSKEYYANADELYNGAALNCFIAAGINVFAALISWWQGRLIRELEELAIPTLESSAPRSSIPRARSRSKPPANEPPPTPSSAPPPTPPPTPSSAPPPTPPPRQAPTPPPRPSARPPQKPVPKSWASPPPKPSPSPPPRSSPGPGPSKQSPKRK